MIETEAVRCNVCGRDDAAVLLEALPPEGRSLDYAASGDAPLHDRLVRCRNCGLVYVSPRPKRQAIEQAYADVDNSLYLEQGNERIETFRDAIRWMAAIGIPKGRLLDVGCAGGFFVKAARDAGWDASGIELSRHLCEFGREKLGVPIMQGTLDQAAFPEHSFDVISFWDVLEHVTDPTAVLRNARRLLKPGGHLVVNVPDYSSIWARLLGRRWWFLIDVHIYYFTPATLEKLFHKCGFSMGPHRMHFQKLRLGYLLKRVEGSFPLLGRTLGALCELFSLTKLPATYYASQTTFVGRTDDALKK